MRSQIYRQGADRYHNSHCPLRFGRASLSRRLYKPFTRQQAEFVRLALAETPLLDALLQHAQSNSIPLHIPGHKQCNGSLQDFKVALSSDLLRLDLTELPGLDNLACPTGVIAKSQALAAKAFGSEHCWYLVNGTSVGLQAAILANCAEGDHILVARNCHSSVLAGLILAAFDTTSQVALGIPPATLRVALDRLKEQGISAKAALVVSPSYFGSCSDIRGLANICHEEGIPLIVDEAHGSHLGLLPEFPASAIQQGADIVVQSTHKTLSSLGQSSMLHCQGKLASPQRLSQCMRMLQTTSPSYLLMASLDAAQAQVTAARPQTPGGRTADFGVPLSCIQETRESLSALPSISLMESSKDSQFIQEPWRITIDTQDLGLTGFEVEQILQQQHGVFPELSTLQVVVFALGVGSTQSHLKSLVGAFREICKPRGGTKTDRAAAFPEASFEDSLRSSYTPEMTPRQAFQADKEMIDFDRALGRLSGDMLCPYPPGIPIVFPGEELTAKRLLYLSAVKKRGGTITGSSDESLQQMSVLRDTL